MLHLASLVTFELVFSVLQVDVDFTVVIVVDVEIVIVPVDLLCFHRSLANYKEAIGMCNSESETTYHLLHHQYW